MMYLNQFIVRLYETYKNRLKLYVEINTHKKMEAEKNGSKGMKALYKLINNAVYGKKLKT